MQTGYGAVQKAIEESNKSRQSGGPSLRPLYWKDGETKIVRFLTDDVVTCRIHEYVLCKQTSDMKDAPSPRDFIDNSSLGEGREDWVEKFGGQAIPYGSKTPENSKSRKMTLGICVLREEAEDFKTSGLYQDVIEVVDYEDDKGNKEELPGRVFCTIKAAHGNFWDPLTGYYLRYETTADRDYEITRRGDSKGTGYTIIPCSPKPDPNLPNEEAVQKFYKYGEKVDESDPDRFLYCPNTLKDWVEDQASEGRARYWLLGERKSENEKSGADSQDSTPTQSSQSVETPSTSDATPETNGTSEAKSVTPPASTEEAKPEPTPPSETKPDPSPSGSTKFAGLRDRIQANRQ